MTAGDRRSRKKPQALLSGLACDLHEFQRLSADHAWVTRRVWLESGGSDRQWDRLLLRIKEFRVPVRYGRAVEVFHDHVRGIDITKTVRGVAAAFGREDVDRLATRHRSGPVESPTDMAQHWK